jgi:hypothetical protein
LCSKFLNTCEKFVEAMLRELIVTSGCVDGEGRQLFLDVIHTT